MQRRQAPNLAQSVIQAWKANDRATTLPIQKLPSAFWELPIPGIPRRTVRAIAAHTAILPAVSWGRAQNSGIAFQLNPAGPSGHPIASAYIR